MDSALKLLVLFLGLVQLIQGFQTQPTSKGVRRCSTAMKMGEGKSFGEKANKIMESVFAEGTKFAKNAAAVAAIAPLLAGGPAFGAGAGPEAWSYRENPFVAKAGMEKSWQCGSCKVGADGKTVCEGCKPPPKICGANADEPCGPENWEYIFPACAGQEQSPINIVQAQPDKKLGPITFTANKAMGSAVLQLSEHNWEVKVPDEYKPENTVTFNGKKYNLLQFHFHTPAEHAIGGGYYDAEMHLVHQNPDTKELLVVGVMYEAGPYADNTVLKRFWGTEPGKQFTLEGNTVALEGRGVSPYQDLLPADVSYFNYPGSLTTPGCNEGVTWIVMKQPVRMSDKQFKAMKDSIAKTERSQASFEGYVNRPVQPVNQRVVKLYTP